MEENSEILQQVLSLHIPRVSLQQSQIFRIKELLLNNSSHKNITQQLFIRFKIKELLKDTVFILQIQYYKFEALYETQLLATCLKTDLISLHAFRIV